MAADDKIQLKFTVERIDKPRGGVIVLMMSDPLAACLAQVIATSVKEGSTVAHIDEFFRKLGLEILGHLKPTSCDACREIVEQATMELMDAGGRN